MADKNLRHVLEYMERVRIQNENGMKDLEEKLNKRFDDIISEMANLRRAIGSSPGQNPLPNESARGHAPPREERHPRGQHSFNNGLRSVAGGSNVKQEATGNMPLFSNNGRCIGSIPRENAPPRFTGKNRKVPHNFADTFQFPSFLEAGETGRLDKNLTPGWTRRGDGNYTDSGSDDDEQKEEDRASSSVRTSIAAPSVNVNESEKMVGGFGSYHHKNINSYSEISTSKMAKPTQGSGDSSTANSLQSVKKEKPCLHLRLPQERSNENGNTSDLRYAGSDTQNTLPPTLNLRPEKIRPRSDIIPIREFFKFGLEGSAAKTIPMLEELNSKQPMESKLDDLQITAMTQIMTSNNYLPDQAHVSALDISIDWSVNTIVPALDVFRVALLNEDLNAILCSIEPTEENRPMGKETIQRLNELLLNNLSNPIRILCCRALANAAWHKSGRELLMTEISTVSEAVASQLSVIKESVHSVQVAAASALGNFARLLLLKTESDKDAELGSRENVLKEIIRVAEKVDSFNNFSPVALIRLLQAIATLMWGAATVIRLAKNRGILSIVERINECVTDDTAKDACRDITEMVLSV